MTQEPQANDGKTVLRTTLLDLVCTEGKSGCSEEEIVDRVIDRLWGGTVRLIGTFRDIPVEILFPRPEGGRP